jgi:hypothetical protein
LTRPLCSAESPRRNRTDLALLDMVIDSYFSIIDVYADRWEALDDEISLGRCWGDQRAHS